MPERTIEQIQEAHTDEWMAIARVKGYPVVVEEARAFCALEEQ